MIPTSILQRLERDFGAVRSVEEYNQVSRFYFEELKEVRWRELGEDYEIAVPVGIRGDSQSIQGIASFHYDSISDALSYSLTTAGLSVKNGPIENSREEKKKILHNPPGIKLLEIAEFLFSRKTYENNFLTLVGDWQEEYFRALQESNISKARWINFRYTLAFVSTMWLKSPIGTFIDLIVKIAK
jgi:hypothetical protein